MILITTPCDCQWILHRSFDEYSQRTMLETNPYILGVTIVVSLVHTVFEFLAFKNGTVITKTF